MLNKLIKYDLIWINKIMLIYFSIAFIFSILTRVIGFFDNSFIGSVLNGIIRSITISVYASCLINAVIRIWVRLRNNTYKDEAYLSNTLPVNKNTMYNSKILSSMITILLCLFVIFICFCIGFLNSDIINFLKESFNNSSFIIFSLLLTIILEVVYMMFCGISGILIGYMKNDRKVLRGVIVGLLLYFCLQIMLIGIIYIIGLFNTDIQSLFNENYLLSNIDSIRLLVIIVNLLYCIVISSLYFSCKHIFMKGINVE